MKQLDLRSTDGDLKFRCGTETLRRALRVDSESDTEPQRISRRQSKQKIEATVDTESSLVNHSVQLSNFCVMSLTSKPLVMISAAATRQRMSSLFSQVTAGETETSLQTRE